MRKKKINRFGNIINQKEIRFVGLKRSGNHAVINWILDQQKGNLLFINDVSKGDINPYSRNNMGINKYCPAADVRNDDDCKDCFLYSYEDKYLSDIFTQKFERNHDKWAGKSENRYDIVVLRDAFNFFASRFSLWYRDLRHPEHPVSKICVKKNGDFVKIKKMWKIYAKEYLCETNHLKHNKIVVNYNLWFASKKYRRELAKKLSIDFVDDNLDMMMADSTFDLKRYGDLGARKLKVFDRWKSFAGNKLYKTIFADKELVELSNKIFGKIPGTEILYKK